MAYVSVPKDLTKVKNKVAFNLTRRQIICFGLAGAAGLPFYFLTRNLIGNSNAMMGMVILMVPAFLFAMYEKDGMPLEKILINIITVRYRRPQIRRYETQNLYERPVTAADTVRIRKTGKSAAASSTAFTAAGNYGMKIDKKSQQYRRDQVFSERSDGSSSRWTRSSGIHVPSHQEGSMH